MNASDLCVKAVQQEWNYYERYSTLVYPFNNNVVHTLGVGLIPQLFAHLYDTRVGLAVNVARHARSCAISYLPLNAFVHIASLMNGVIYIWPPFSGEKGVVKSLSAMGSEIEAYATRPLLAGAATLILTGIFFSLGVLQHPLREVRRIRPMVPFLLSCLFLILAGTYVFYATCQLQIREKVIASLSQKCS